MHLPTCKFVVTSSKIPSWYFAVVGILPPSIEYSGKMLFVRGGLLIWFRKLISIPSYCPPPPHHLPNIHAITLFVLLFLPSLSLCLSYDLSFNFYSILYLSLYYLLSLCSLLQTSVMICLLLNSVYQPLLYLLSLSLWISSSTNLYSDLSLNFYCNLSLSLYCLLFLSFCSLLQPSFFICL